MPNYGLHISFFSLANISLEFACRILVIDWIPGHWRITSVLPIRVTRDGNVGK